MRCVDGCRRGDRDDPCGLPHWPPNPRIRTPANASFSTCSSGASAHLGRPSSGVMPRRESRAPTLPDAPVEAHDRSRIDRGGEPVRGVRQVLAYWDRAHGGRAPSEGRRSGLRIRTIRAAVLRGLTTAVGSSSSQNLVRQPPRCSIRAGSAGRTGRLNRVGAGVVNEESQHQVIGPQPPAVPRWDPRSARARTSLAELLTPTSSSLSFEFPFPARRRSLRSAAGLIPPTRRRR